MPYGQDYSLDIFPPVMAANPIHFSKERLLGKHLFKLKIVHGQNNPERNSWETQNSTKCSHSCRRPYMKGGSPRDVSMKYVHNAFPSIKTARGDPEDKLRRSEVLIIGTRQKEEGVIMIPPPNDLDECTPEMTVGGRGNQLA